ncbi:MAG: DoxX family protein [Methylomonas sp.]|jgi:putative oxidoreductase|uniref:HvfX family Cu-binding RiPP maturation protein n=1 Tax=Methylomonas sp. TaxID=418 RepID=UPI0025FE2681|nr:DoxX family protein [Methylomonas sp.]MCK9606653.1 DoxX family protein [Methylomonas sp.]
MNQTQTSPGSSCISCEISAGIARIRALPRQLSHWLDRHAPTLAPTFLRLLLAYEFGEAGLEKLQGENWFTELNFPFPFNMLPADFSWTLATGLEIIAPLALLLGFMTRFFSAALIVLSVVAIAAVHWPADWQSLNELWKGYAISDHGYGNYKLPLMYILMLSTLLFSGAGRLSLDNYLKTRLSTD